MVMGDLMWYTWVQLCLFCFCFKLIQRYVFQVVVFCLVEDNSKLGFYKVQLRVSRSPGFFRYFLFELIYCCALHIPVHDMPY